MTETRFLLRKLFGWSNLKSSFDDDRGKGTVVDFVALRQSLHLADARGWRQLYTYLGSYPGKSFVPNVPVDAQPNERITRSKALSHYFRLEPLKKTSYLILKRYFSIKTLQHPAFVGKIFNKPYTSKETGEYITNTTFSLENL